MQVRGATTHYEAVVSAATSGVMNAGVDTGGDSMVCTIKHSAKCCMILYAGTLCTVCSVLYWDQAIQHCLTHTNSVS